MRRPFVDELSRLMKLDDSIYVLLGDLGYGLFDNLREEFPDRCINFGASEQLMLGAATGLALENKIPVCYSITPFLVYRPFEFIRNYLHEENIPVKLVGSGRDKDYLGAGYTHHSSEIGSILDQLPNIKQFFPSDESELLKLIKEFVYSNRPSFLSLRK
jgi:transketolase